MTLNIKSIILLLVAAVLPATAFSSPVMMSAEWAQNACDAWNNEPVLTNDLVDSGWVSNDDDRGFKIMQIYRTDCENSEKVEMHISEKDGKAQCIYGGALTNNTLSKKVDYVMHATTERWQQMGAGEYGPMKAMMFGRLKFTGPKWEAMQNMGPFKKFLLLAGTVPSEQTTCPQ